MDVFFCPLKIASGSSADLLQELLSNLRTGDCTGMWATCALNEHSIINVGACFPILALFCPKFVCESFRGVCFSRSGYDKCMATGSPPDLPARRPVVVCHLQTEPGIVKLSSVV